MGSSYAADRALMERIAEAIRGRTDRILIAGTVQARVVDDEKAGCWLEIEAGPWMWTASDINGPWGITTLIADQVSLTSQRNRQMTYQSEDGRIFYWYANREDGPETTDVDEIVEYLLGAM